jgi:hypothetical protein
LAPVVFFETSTLVAASIRALEGDIEHSKYSEAKGLVNLVANKEIIGITSLITEEQANKVLEKALLDVMELENRPTTVDEFRKYSTILDAIQRKYLENISHMDRLSIDKEEVDRIEKEEVYPMYDRLEYEARNRPPKVTSSSPRFKGVARDVNRMIFGRYKRAMIRLEEKSIVPDRIDRIILSEAIYLKRTRFPKEKYCLASLDNHFCGFTAPHIQIPISIKEYFDISCCSPSEIIKKIREK